MERENQSGECGSVWYHTSWAIRWFLLLPDEELTKVLVTPEGQPLATAEEIRGELRKKQREGINFLVPSDCDHYDGTGCLGHPRSGASTASTEPK